jgi:hypothetical protein
MSDKTKQNSHDKKPKKKRTIPSYEEHAEQPAKEYSESEMQNIMNANFSDFDSSSDEEIQKVQKEVPNSRRVQVFEMFRNDIKECTPIWDQKNEAVIGKLYTTKFSFKQGHCHSYYVPPVKNHVERTNGENARSRLARLARGGIFSEYQSSYLENLSKDRYASITSIVNEMILATSNDKKSIKEIENNLCTKTNYATTSCYYVLEGDHKKIWVCFCIDPDNKATYLTYCINVQDFNNHESKAKELKGVIFPEETRNVALIKSLKGNVLDFFIYFCGCDKMLGVY